MLPAEVLSAPLTFEKSWFSTNLAGMMPIFEATADVYSHFMGLLFRILGLSFLFIAQTTPLG